MEVNFVVKESRIKPVSRFNEIMDMLKGYSTSIYTNEDDGYDYLDDGYFCIAVLNPAGEDDLYIDIEDGFTLTYGDWDAHYEPYPRQYQHMCEDIRKFLQGDSYLAVVNCGKDWICSLSIDEPKINKAALKDRIKDFLHSADCDVFIRQMNKAGCEINCNFWDVKKSKTFHLRPGEF
jgi:hypothetical protein